MWIGWVESTFTNSTEQILIIHLRRRDYAKLCMSPSLDGTLPEYVISQEDNAIDFVHRSSKFLTFLGYQYSFWSSSFINAWTFISALTYLSVKEEGRYIFMKSKILFKTIVYSAIRQLYCFDITDFRRVPPERVTYTQLMKPLKNHISWLDYPILPKLLLLGF